MSLADLQAVLPPPPKPKDVGSEAAWTAAEAALGMAYPRHFKEFTAMYGSCTIGGVITMINPMSVEWSGAPGRATLPPTLAKLLASLNPFASPRDTWLYGMASTLAVCDAFDTLAFPGRSQGVPVQLWPQLPGLFPWAQGDSGQALLWWMEGAAEEWPVVLADPTEGLLAYEKDMTDLLAGWLTRTVEISWLPPPRKPLFRRMSRSA